MTYPKKPMNQSSFVTCEYNDKCIHKTKHCYRHNENLPNGKPV